MNQSSQTLPENFELVFSTDLATKKTMAIVLGLVGVGVTLLTLWLLAIFSNFIHPELYDTSHRGSFNLVGFLLLVLLFPLNLIVHEIIHGIFFWIFTHSKPVFALRLTYAYAAAPDWYIPKNKYWIISLAPLVIIGIAGLLVMVFCPPAFILPAAVVVGFNTGGSVGDIWIVYRLFRSSPSCLVKDTGHGIYFYQSHLQSPLT
jgi:hypothetical protein